jgi:hypothetical protein
MPSESFRPEFHQIDEFNFDSAFVNSDNSASHSLGQTNLRKIRPSFLFDLACGTERRFTFDPVSALSPIWSPTGSHIVWTSTRKVLLPKCLI